MNASECGLVKLSDDACGGLTGMRFGICISNMPIGHAYRICISGLHIHYASRMRISDMRIQYVYLDFQSVVFKLSSPRLFNSQRLERQRTIA